MNKNENITSSKKLMQEPSRRQRWGWYLFDFANSILIMNGGLYFPQWIVIDNHVSDFWFNLTLIISSIFLLLTAPLLGHLSDIGVRKIDFLRITSLVMFFGGILVGIFGYIIVNPYWRVTICLIGFALIMYAYQLSLVFYNVMLGVVSQPSRYARTSGWGLAWGWIGGILAILVITPFVQGYIPPFSSPNRLHAILPSTLLYGILVVVSLRLLGHTSIASEQKQSVSGVSILSTFRQTFQSIKGLLKISTVFWFLCAYFLFSDAILTIQNNSTIYMERVFSLPDNAKAMVFIFFLIASSLGGIASARFSETLGLHQSLKYTLISWVLLCAAAAITSNSYLGMFLLSIMGFFNGALWNLSRVYFFRIIPEQQRGKFFGIYSSFERAATILGPLVWNLPLNVKWWSVAAGYQIAVALMGILILVSIALFEKSKNPID